MPTDTNVPSEVFAWVGEDEFGRQGAGIKQVLWPQLLGPLAGVNRERMEEFAPALQNQVNQYGKPMKLVRYVPVEVLIELTQGEQKEEQP